MNRTAKRADFTNEIVLLRGHGSYDEPTMMGVALITGEESGTTLSEGDIRPDNLGTAATLKAFLTTTGPG